MNIEHLMEKIDNQLAELNDDVRGQVHKLAEQVTQMQRQLDAVDLRTQNGASATSTASNFWATDLVNGLQRELSAFDKHGRVRYEIRTITSTGIQAPVVYPEIGLAAAAAYGAVRRLFPTVPIDAAAIYAVSEQSASGWVASPQVEGGAKQESNVTLSAETLPVRTIATWIAVSRQALDDVKGLESFIQARLLWALERTIEEQILLGSGSGENLRGLIVTAQDFNTALLPSSWNYADQIAAAALQVRQNGFNPTFVVMSPVSAYYMRLLKATTGEYLDVSRLSLPQLVESPAMSSQTFLVGDASQAIIRSRQTATIEVSSEHADFFAKNLIAIRAEERLALQTLSSAAFVRGTLTQSPA